MIFHRKKLAKCVNRAHEILKFAKVDHNFKTQKFPENEIFWADFRILAVNRAIPLLNSSSVFI